MEFLTDLASGGGVLGAITGAIGGIASAFVKYKTMKEQNRHKFTMAELAGRQEIQRAAAELKLRRIEGDIQTELATEESLQQSFKHDAALGEWMRGRELGWFGTVVLSTAEFVRMMMRPVLTVAACVYVFRMYGSNFELVTDHGIPDGLLVSQLELIGSTIVLLATVSFTWWFADRSVAKTLLGKING